MLEGMMKIQVQDNETIEARHSELTTAICKQIAINTEKKRLMLQFELRIYEQIAKFNEEMEILEERLKNI